MNIKYPNDFNVYHYYTKNDVGKWQCKNIKSDNLENALKFLKDNVKNFIKIYKIEPISVWRKKVRLMMAQYYKNNTKKCVESVIKWQKRNPQKHKINSDNYRNNNRVEINKRALYRSINKYHSDPIFRAKVLNARKLWAKENPEKAKLKNKNKYLKNKSKILILLRMKNQAFYEIYQKLNSINDNNIIRFCNKIKGFVSKPRKPIPLYMEKK